MTVQPHRCLARVQLGDQEIAWLSDRPLAAHEVRTTPYCELEMGHSGPHTAMGQQGENSEWWVRWTLLASEIFETDNCGAQSDEPINEHGEHDPCLLYSGHPGRHSFEFRAS